MYHLVLSIMRTFSKIHAYSILAYFFVVGVVDSAHCNAQNVKSAILQVTMFPGS